MATIDTVRILALQPLRDFENTPERVQRIHRYFNNAYALFTLFLMILLPVTQCKEYHSILDFSGNALQWAFSPVLAMWFLGYRLQLFQSREDGNQRSVNTRSSAQNFLQFVHNEFVSNMFISNEYIKNEFVTHEFVTNEFVTNEFVSNEFITNEFTTNEFVTNEFVTNEFVSNESITNEFTTNEVVTNVFVSNEYVLMDNQSVEPANGETHPADLSESKGPGRPAYDCFEQSIGPLKDEISAAALDEKMNEFDDGELHAVDGRYFIDALRASPFYLRGEYTLESLAEWFFERYKVKFWEKMKSARSMTTVGTKKYDDEKSKDVLDSLNKKYLQKKTKD